jgi:hypothetical protein
MGMEESIYLQAGVLQNVNLCRLLLGLTFVLPRRIRESWEMLKAKLWLRFRHLVIDRRL